MVDYLVAEVKVVRDLHLIDLGKIDDLQDDDGVHVGGIVVVDELIFHKIDVVISGNVD